MHYTPKRGSWLNAAELEASLVSRECLGRRRIDSLLQLTGEVFAWNRSADRDRRSIEWKFRHIREAAALLQRVLLLHHCASQAPWCGALALTLFPPGSSFARRPGEPTGKL